MADLELHRDLIDQAGLQLVIIGPADVDNARDLLAQREMPVPVYVDASGDLFAAYGLNEGSMLDNARHVGTYRRYISALLSGARSGGVKGNPRQLPGTAIVDDSGRLRLHQTGKHAADHMQVSDLLDAVIEIRQLDRKSADMP